MSALAERSITSPVLGRSAKARRRLSMARALLAECRFCAHDCGVDRRTTPAGKCHAGAVPRVFLAQTEVTDELELIPTFAIAFSGCDLRCLFCITGKESWDAREGILFNAANLAERAATALEEGAKTIMLLGGEPTIHLPSVIELVACLPDSVRLVWKTNAHGSRPARELLDGLFDIWLADYKFGNDYCARSLAGIDHYLGVVQENLRWASVNSELIVRHLLMPGHLECCWIPVARWLAEELPGVKVNLRDGFWPAWKSGRRHELQQPITTDESKRAFRLAHELGLNLVP